MTTDLPLNDREIDAALNTVTQRLMICKTKLLEVNGEWRSLVKQEMQLLMTLNEAVYRTFKKNSEYNISVWMRSVDCDDMSWVLVNMNDPWTQLNYYQKELDNATQCYEMCMADKQWLELHIEDLKCICESQEWPKDYMSSVVTQQCMDKILFLYRDVFGLQWGQINW